MTRRLLLVLLSLASAVLAAPEAASTAAEDIRDIRGPVATETLPPFSLSGGALLALAALLFVRRHGPVADHPPDRSPTDRHFDWGAALAALAAEHGQGTYPPDQIIARLDEILRAAVAAATGIGARQRTSAELDVEAQAFLDEEDRIRLRGLLSLFDRVKFAAHQPGRHEVDRALDAAASLVASLACGNSA